MDSKSYEISLRRDGSNLTNLFNHYKNNEGLLWKQKYIENLKLSLRSLVDIDVADLRDFMTLRLLEKNREVELSDVSEGTIKMMLWGMLFCAPSSVKYDLLAIDEPEANLHPAWQKILADNILLSESYEQCVISTHSPDFLDRFTDAFINGIVSVYVFDLQGHINNISYREIAEDLGDWQLGDLYRTQDPALGGWPW